MVRILMVDALEHFGHDHAREIRGDLGDFLNLKPGHGHGFGKFVR